MPVAQPLTFSFTFSHAQAKEEEADRLLAEKEEMEHTEELVQVKEDATMHVQST